MTSIIDETNTGTKIFTNFDVKGNTNIVQGNLNINGNLNVDNWSVIKQLDMYNNAYFHGDTKHFGPINASNQNDSSISDLDSASFVCKGGASIMKNLIVAGDIHLLSNISISANLVVAANTIIEDKLLVHNEDDSISTQTGSGIFRGGLGISKNINIGYNAVIGTPLSENFFGVDELSIKDAKKSLESGSTLQVSGPGFIKEDLFVGKNINVIGNLSVHGSFTKLLTENIVADDPLIVLGANSTKEHDENPSGFVSKYGKLNLQNQFEHQFTGLVRMPHNNIQHNLWIQMNKPYNLIQNIDINPLSISDEPKLKDNFNNYINFDNNQLSDLNIKNLSTQGHVNIKGNLNIESTGFLKLPVGNSNNRPKGINFINNTDELYTLNHPYRKTNGLLRFNMDETLDNNKNGILELYFVKEGKRWDGQDFYHSDNYDSNNILHKGLAGWRKIGPYRLDNLDSSTRIEVENSNLINDQVISFYTSNKLRMSIFPDKSFNNNTSYHKLAVDDSVLEGAISMGQISNINYNVRGIKLINDNNTRYRLSYTDNISRFSNSLTLNHTINSNKIKSVNNPNSIGLELEIQIVNGLIINIYAINSGENYLENEILLLNLDDTLLIPNFINITLSNDDLFVIDKGLTTHIGFNKPMSTLDIAGNLNVSHNITTGDYFGLKSNKLLSLTNEIQNGSNTKPWRNYLSCNYKSPNNILHIKETKDSIDKFFHIKIVPNKYSLTQLLNTLEYELNNNSLYNYNYIVTLLNNKININIDNLVSNNKSTLLFSKSNSYNIFAFKENDYEITINNPIISDYEIYDNNLFEIYENDILNNDITITVNDKKANINLINHNIEKNTNFNIVPQFQTYYIFDGTNHIKIPDNLGPINTKVFTLHFNINLASYRYYNFSTVYYQGSNNTFINIYINQNNKIVIKFDNNSSYTSINSINNDTWTNINISLNITLLKIKINNVEDSVHTINNNFLNNIVDLNKDYFIGSRNNDDNFTGYINNLVFYKNKQETIETHNEILNNSNVLFYFNSENIIDINGIVKDNVINNNSFDIIINDNEKFDINNDIFINNKLIDCDSINDKYIILDNIDDTIVYNINNIIKQNNNTGQIVSLNNGSNIVLTIDSSKNTFIQTIKGNNWILNKYLIQDNNNDIDVISGYFDVHVTTNNITKTSLNIQSDLKNYRVGQNIILNDIRNGNGAIFDLTIINNNITNITLINGGNNYIENDILTISKSNINGTSVNNKASQDIKIKIFNNNIVSGVIDNISINNIIQNTKESLNQTISNVSSNTFKGNDITCNIIPTITQIQHGYNYGNAGDVIIIEDTNPPTKIKTNTNLINNITNNISFTSNITHITQDDDIVLNTGDLQYDSNRQINDKARFQIKTDNDGNIIELIALKGNNYKIGDIIHINNIPGNTEHLIVQFNNNSIITYNPASFKVTVIDTTHTSTELYNSNLNGYLIKNQITLEGGNPIHPIILEVNINNIVEISSNNWIPNYYNLIDNNNINYNVIVDEVNNINETFVYLREDSSLNTYSIGDNVILEDNRNGSNVEFNIQIINNKIVDINIVNSGNNYKNNDIITISKDDIPGSNFGKSTQDVIIKVYDNNIDEGSINNISLNNIIQHPENAFDTTGILLISNSTIQNGTNITLEINGSYNETIGQNWLPNKTYNYIDTNGAAFNVVVDSNGDATTSIDFVTNPNGINSYSNNQQIIISDLTPIKNSNKILIYVTNGNFNTYDMIKYKNDDNIFIDVGIPNLIYYKEITINTNINYSFIKNSKINQKFTYINTNNNKLYLNKNIKYNRFNDILFGDKLLLNDSTNNTIIYDVNKVINNNITINTKNNKSYVDFISHNHNLDDDNIINITNKYNNYDFLNKDVNIYKETLSSFYYNNISHINNTNSDIKLTFDNEANISYNNDSINNWNNGIYYYIDPNPPTVLRHDINLYNNSNNTNNLTFDSNESFEYITQTSNISTNGSSTNLKFKFIIINSIISSIYCIYGNNVSIDELITIEIFNNNISKGTYTIKLEENNIISNALEFTINVKSNKPYIFANNLQLCSNYPLNHIIQIPRSVTGIFTNDTINVKINSVLSINSNISNNNNYEIGTHYFIDKLKETQIIEENKYIISPVIYNGTPLLKSYGFNGTNNFVYIPEYNSPQLSNTNFTIEFFANIVAPEQYGFYPIFIQGVWSPPNGSMCSIYQYDRFIHLDFFGRFIACYNENRLGQWTHYAFTFDNNSIDHQTAGKIYINGVIRNNTANVNNYDLYGSNNDDLKLTNGTNASGPIYLGTNNVNNYYLGELKQLKIYNSIKYTQNFDINNLFYSNNYIVNLNQNNTIDIINNNNFTLHYNDENNNYTNNILSTIGFTETQTNSNSYTSNKLSYYKYSGFIRKPENNRFYLIKDQIETIITDDNNKDILEPNFVINKDSDLIKTELEVSKLILNDGSINTNNTPSEGMIQYNVIDNYNYLNAYIKEYPTNILRNIGLAQYNYFTYQFYFNDLSDKLQWGNRVSGQIDPDIAVFSKTVLNRFAWIGNQNIFIQYIEINVDEINNNTKRHYQLRIVNDDAIDNRDINDNTGVFITTSNTIDNSICIDGTNKKKEINVVPINSDLLFYNSDNNNLINNNCLKINGGIDKYIGLQLSSIINNNSIGNECVVVLRGFTSFY